MKKLAFCEQNLVMGTQYVIDYLKEKKHLQLEISIARCLGECGECFSNCIADYHGELLSYKTPEELLEAILKRYEEDISSYQ